MVHLFKNLCYTKQVRVKRTNTILYQRKVSYGKHQENRLVHPGLHGILHGLGIRKRAEWLRLLQRSTGNLQLDSDVRSLFRALCPDGR